MNPDELANALRCILTSSEPDLAYTLARTMLGEAVAFLAHRDGDQTAAAMLRADADLVARFVMTWPDHRPTDAVLH